MDALDQFNELPEVDAVRELTACCAAPGWAEAVAGGRPYRDLTSLTVAGAAAVADLPWEAVAAALAAHPRIGETAAGAGRDAAWSRQEQAAVADADQGVRAELADANRAYERRFDRVFLVFATGKSPAQLLAAVRERLSNDEETERHVVRAELAKITELRLRRLVAP